MIESVRLDFKCNDKIASIKLYSKFTGVVGINSGEGKTELLAKMEQLSTEGMLSMSASNGSPVAISSVGNLMLTLQYTEQSIIIIDEALTLRKDLLLAMVKSNHLFVCICRTLPLRGAYPLCGIYHIERYEDWYQFNEASLPLYSGTESIDLIITESSKDSSEYELLNVYTDKLNAAAGRDRLYKHIKLNKDKNILVLCDLGNIGKAYSILKYLTDEYPNVYFYDYQAFEELLYKSKLVGGDISTESIKPTDFLSIEQFYEKVLEQVTSGTVYEYKHKKPLAGPYINKNNMELIFNTNVGRKLYDLLLNWCCTANVFDAKVYLKEQLGNKYDYLAQASINDCISKEDCDKLIEETKSYKW